MDKMSNIQEHTKQSALIHLMEKIGEIARKLQMNITCPEGFSKNLGTGLADTPMFIILLADLYDIDITKEMEKSIYRTKKNLRAILHNTSLYHIFL